MDRLTHPNNVTKFILLGLTQNPQLQKILFMSFCSFSYLPFCPICSSPLPFPLAPPLTFSCHVLLSHLLVFHRCLLHLCHHPHNDIHVFYQRRTISLGSCLTQLFVEQFLEGSEIILLIVTAYDHYVAICKPLHYVTIMRWPLLPPGAVAWIGGVLNATVHILFMLNLPFCGPNVIDHFMCDLFPLLKLACRDTYRLRMIDTANSGAMCLPVFPMLLTSYIVILSSLKSHGSGGQCKVLSNCRAHFIIVVLFFVPCIFTYMGPVVTYPVDKLVIVFFAILTSMFNPVIYVVRNTE